ncbi:MAG: endonuclease V [Candidatus Riflebacteria bacterium]|nr:endonuclease V [Candidatus Riflebacteria bacterium]
MKFEKLHDWNLSLHEAAELQVNLREKLIIFGNPEVRYIAGIDCSTQKDSDQIWAAAVVYDLNEQKAIEVKTFQTVATFPYISGYLCFREGPAVLGVISKLSATPDIFMFDGHGIAHPRGLGIASHLGLWLGRPSIGCAKSRLIGNAPEPAQKKGSFQAIYLKEKQLGILLRTKDGINPIWVSPGHLIGINESANIVLRCCNKYRIPEPTRLAHFEVNNFRKKKKPS